MIIFFPNFSQDSFFEEMGEQIKFLDGGWAGNRMATVMIYASSENTRLYFNFAKPKWVQRIAGTTHSSHEPCKSENNFLSCQTKVSFPNSWTTTCLAAGPCSPGWASPPSPARGLRSSGSTCLATEMSSTSRCTRGVRRSGGSSGVRRERCKDGHYSSSHPLCFLCQFPTNGSEKQNRYLSQSNL